MRVAATFVPAVKRWQAMDAYTWVTAEGERIPVRKMTDNHLLNAIAQHRIAMANVLRSEGAPLRARDIDAIDFHLIQVVPAYAKMLIEIKVRRLKDRR